MKKHRYEDKFIRELEKFPNISVACEKTGLSRQTVYRWMRNDINFKRRVEEASDVGIDSVNDLAESKLISNINQGNQRSIEYWLTNHKRNYRPQKPAKPKEEQFVPVETIVYVIDK